MARNAGRKRSPPRGRRQNFGHPFEKALRPSLRAPQLRWGPHDFMARNAGRKRSPPRGRRQNFVILLKRRSGLACAPPNCVGAPTTSWRVMPVANDRLPEGAAKISLILLRLPRPSLARLWRSEGQRRRRNRRFRRRPQPRPEDAPRAQSKRTRNGRRQADW